jgi:tetratricopeptide (TPR) repeat protein
MEEPDQYADFTIKITRPALDQYWVELSYAEPEGSTEQQPAGGQARFDFQALLAADLSPEEYGRLLGEALFGKQALREYFLECLSAAGTANRSLRVRILVDSSASELHRLRWELLRNPDDGDFMALQASRPFSRFLYSDDWRQVELRSKASLRALVAVANPSNLKKGLKLLEHTLAEVDVAGELSRAERALQDIPIVVLESRENEPGRVTKQKLLERLGEGYDILYLVCHGAILPDDPYDPESPTRPYLILEKEDGKYDRVAAEDLAMFIARQQPEKRPRLVLLASCQSGGQGKVPVGEKDRGEKNEEERSYDRGALAAIGPRLVEVGVPAVVAMQDNVKMETVRLFTPYFFKKLLEHGQVDLAMSQARSDLLSAGRPDWWSPVVYLRLRGGKLWEESAPVPYPGEVSSYLVPVPVIHNFVGRDLELEAYRERLRAERIAIITGLGGVGKSYLGAKLARETANHEEEIFWFDFDRSTNNTSEAMLWALAAFLASKGCPEPWRYFNGEIKTHKSLELTSKLVILLNALRSGDYVVCLDDFEVVRDEPTIVEFFTFIREKGVGASYPLPARFIIMGRELPSDMDYLVAEPLHGFLETDAKVFIKAFDVKLSDESIHRLWELTEGNPMLIRMSISTLQALSREGLITDDFFDRMAEEGDVRDFLMNNILAHFAPQEKETLNALSIFPAPIERQNARRFLAMIGIGEANQRITTLINKWILSESGDGFLRLHRLVREFCYRMLEPEDREKYHRAAAQYFLELQEYLAAGYHYLESGAFDQALDFLTGHVREIVNAGGASALREQLTRFRWKDLTSKQKAAVLRARGDTYSIEGNYEKALGEYADALKRVREKKDLARLRYQIGLAYSASGQYKAAIQDLQESISLSVEIGDPPAHANAQCATGWAYYRLGQFQEAEDQFEVCHQAGFDLNDDILVARAGLGLGLLAWAKGDLQNAQSYFEDSYRYFHDYGDRVGEVDALIDLGLVYSMRGDLDQERSQYLQAKELAEQIGDVHSLRIIYNNLGNLHQMLQEYDQAADAYHQLAELARTTGHQPLLSTAGVGLADAYLAAGALPQAEANAREALAIAEELGPSVELAASYRALGDICFAQGDANLARDWFEKSIPMLQELQEDEELAKARQGLELAIESLKNRPLKARRASQARQNKQPPRRRPFAE